MKMSHERNKSLVDEKKEKKKDSCFMEPLKGAFQLDISELLDPKKAFNQKHSSLQERIKIIRNVSDKLLKISLIQK